MAIMPPTFFAAFFFAAKLRGSLTHLSHDNHHDASSASPAVSMIIMSTHLPHLKSHDNHHDASSASPMLSNTTLEMYSIERDCDDYDDDDDDDIDDEGDKDDDCDDNCPAVIMIIM